MCDERHRFREDPRFRVDRDGCCDEPRGRFDGPPSERPHSFGPCPPGPDFRPGDFDSRRFAPPDPPPNPLRDMKERIYEHAEDAFQEILYEKCKARLEAVWGEKIDEIAKLCVDHFVKAKEREVEGLTAERDLDMKLREAARKS